MISDCIDLDVHYTDASRCITESRIQAAYHSVNRFLEWQSSDTDMVSQDALPFIMRESGFLIIMLRLIMPRPSKNHVHVRLNS